MIESDHIPLNEFRTSWRWIEAGHHELTPDELSRIRPFGPARAQEVWAQALEFAGGGPDLPPSAALFEPPSVLREPYENPQTLWWLREHLPEVPTELIVCWQPDEAILTDSALFIDRWESFCYPAMDDTSVWPIHQSWLLQIWHEEVFWFARRRPR